MSLHYSVVPRFWECFIFKKRNIRYLLDMSLEAERKFNLTYIKIGGGRGRKAYVCLDMQAQSKEKNSPTPARSQDKIVRSLDMP